MPDVRIVAAELSVTNVRGTSQVNWASYAGTPDGGLRTLSGGQIVLQVNGPLAIQSNAVPAIMMDAAHAIRDVSATVTEGPTDAPVNMRVTVDGETLCSLTIPDGAILSDAVDGATLPAVQSGVKIGLDITGVGQTMPGTGLSVSIRF
jgi:hypothetical protein